MSRIKVLNIIGCGRSGSTILGNMLGQLPGWVHVGELCYVWNRGFMQDALCGCGEPFSRCGFWGRVVERSGLDLGDREAARLARFPRRANRRLARTILQGRGPLGLVDGIDDYLGALRALYRALEAETGARVIVDSTKSPAHCYLLGAADELDVHGLHLVRDARAVAHSWNRGKVRRDRNPDDPRPMDRFSSARSAVKWTYANLSVELVRKRTGRRVHLVRYEDFVVDPGGTLERIARLVEEPSADTPMVSDRLVWLEPTHTVWGNPSRLQTGPVELRMDVEWQRRMSLRDRAVVSAITWPLQRRYRRVASGRSPVKGADARPEGRPSRAV